MQVKVWRSFSANNSASVYLVSRFATADAATICRDELADYLRSKEDELVAMSNIERSRNRGLTMATLEFGERVGIDWPSYLASGHADDDEITVDVAGSDLIIAHDDCLGFEVELSQYLTLRGATAIEDQRFNRTPVLSVVVTGVDAANGPLIADLTAFASERAPSAHYAEAGRAEFAATVAPAHFELARAVCEKHGAIPYMRVEGENDLARVAAIAAARCLECASPMSYLPAEVHDLPADQMACSVCGGMFQLVIPE